MARILLIEDETTLLKSLERDLRQGGHEVLSAPHGAEGLRLARESRPDIILLDIMRPGSPDHDACRTLRGSEETRDVPFVIVSARGDENDRIAGFELGAADYVVKPFSVRELLLRVAAILRRVRSSPRGPLWIEFGKLRVDTAAHRVWVDGDPVELTVIERKLLVALYESRERVLTRAGLLTAIRGEQASITARAIDVHVARLREKLGQASDYIQTVRGIGYRFAASSDVTEPCPD